LGAKLIAVLLNTAPQIDLSECASEWQIVMCGDIPLSSVRKLKACCEAHKPVVDSPSWAGDGTVQAASIARSDVISSLGGYVEPMDFQLGFCTEQVSALVPAFYKDASGGATLVRGPCVDLGVPARRAVSLLGCGLKQGK
jgi:hypothetical protein